MSFKANPLSAPKTASRSNQSIGFQAATEEVSLTTQKITTIAISITKKITTNLPLKLIVRRLSFPATKSKKFTKFTTNMTAASPGKKPYSLLVSIMLPLLFVFLLPSLELEQAHITHVSSDNQESDDLSLSTTWPWITQSLVGSSDVGSTSISSTSSNSNLPLMMSELLLALVRFPFDRLRLVSGLASVSAKEISSKHDLQEEEDNHMEIMAPVEHRSAAYSAARQPLATSASSYQQQVSRLAPPRAEPGHAYTESAQAASDLQPADYASATSGDEPTAGLGSVEGTALADSGQTGLEGPNTALQTRSDLPAVRALNVKCEKNHMTVNIVFDRPFYGMVFSKGHYNDQKCVHLPANSGQTSVNFDIHLGKCGMTSSDASGNPHANVHALQQQQQHQSSTNGQQQQPNGLYIENTIIIQYDPQVQEIYDQARKLRCTWYDYYEKSVTFRPYNVDMLDAVTANFLGDNIQCWMQIQVGKGPWSSEVAGIVKIGQTMTMVLAIKDDENRFDMLVRNCVAHDGKHQPIQLVDEYGCVARPKIMAKFQKVRNFGPAATVVSYAHFQAFKFPDSMSVHFQCVIQVCRYECPEPVCQNQQQQATIGATGGGGGLAEPAAGGGAATDYAVSGTEIVSSKEPMPTASSGLGYFVANNSMAHPSATSAGPQSAGVLSAVNLKLDETQGRVQVKLDTSMMAGLGHHHHQSSGMSRAQAASTSGNGPLPPHLLHLGSAGSGHDSQKMVGFGTPSEHTGQTYMSSPYYKQHSSQGGATSSRPVQFNGRAQVAPTGHHQVHYSSPYQNQQQPNRAGAGIGYATNRLGELLQEPANDDEDQLLMLHSSNGGGGSPLSLIASPRGLHMTSPVDAESRLAQEQLASVANHRHRRSPQSAENQDWKVEQTDNATKLENLSAERKARQLRSQDSTAIKTQRSIQVVSPDDVAFSLLAGDQMDNFSGLKLISSSRDSFGLADRGMVTSESGQSPQLTSSTPRISTVCFSATKLMFGVLVTLATVASSIVIVAFVLLRQQRANQLLEEKLCEPAEFDSQDIGSTRQLQQRYSLGVARHHSQQQHEDSMVMRRQEEEIHQRNNYLARLYSQFMPATYWRT